MRCATGSSLLSIALDRARSIVPGGPGSAPEHRARAPGTAREQRAPKIRRVANRSSYRSYLVRIRTRRGPPPVTSAEVEDLLGGARHQVLGAQAEHLSEELETMLTDVPAEKEGAENGEGNGEPRPASPA